MIQNVMGVWKKKPSHMMAGLIQAQFTSVLNSTLEVY